MARGGEGHETSVFPNLWGHEQSLYAHKNVDER